MGKRSISCIPERKSSGQTREHNTLRQHKEQMKTKYTKKGSSFKMFQQNYSRSKREKSEEKTEDHSTGRRGRGVKRANSPTFLSQSKNISKFYKRYYTGNQTINVFWKKGSPFSQFFTAHFVIKSRKYSCTEQYMMSEKARFFGDKGNLLNIMQSNNPNSMKAFGRQVQGFDPDIWNMCCRQIVHDGNRAKFTQSKSLLQTMLETEERYFAEASPYDRIWGIGMAPSDADVYNPRKWRGSNWLGEALNQVKFEIQSIIYTSNNNIELSHHSIEEIFQVGLRERFEKMECFIKIERNKYSDTKTKSHKAKYASKRKYKHRTPPREVLSGTAKLKRQSCKYIMRDWARERILDSPEVLSLFLNLKRRDIRDIPGYFSYESSHNRIMSCTRVSRVLRKLSHEFNAIRKLVAKESDSIRRYTCSRAHPCKPQKF